jgi:outer membrane biosynthesis protein TonB
MINTLKFTLAILLLGLLSSVIHPQTNEGQAKQQPDDKVYKEKEVEEKAILIETPEPEFPVESRRNCGDGKWVVQIRAVLLGSGQVGELKVIQKASCKGLTESALHSAHEVKFKPARIGGKPVSQYYILKYTFNLY